MRIRTMVGYIRVDHRPSGWWRVQRGARHAASTSLPTALWVLGFETAEARAIAGSITRDHGQTPSSATPVG